MRATARAFANVALVKYFGKRDSALNLPAAGSLSLTLEPLATETTVVFEEGLEEDTVLLGDAPAGAGFSLRTSNFLELLRQRAGVRTKARVATGNNFPTAAGLASSASGFAALTLAASGALGLELSERELSVFARRGSGSACRSVPGGIAVWHAGVASDGSDSFAERLSAPDEWDLRMLIGIVDPGPKEIGSTEAMEHVRQSSPLYDGWIASVGQDLPRAMDAVANKDFTALGEVTEGSALAMHAATMAARPGIIYWKPTTLEGLHVARQLRREGIEAYFTCDAGPQPKLLCRPEQVKAAAQRLESLPGIHQVIHCRLGPGVTQLD